MTKNFAAALCFFVLCSISENPCYASDGASFELGKGSGNGDWMWHVGGYWDAQLGQWSGSDHRTVTDLGLTPVFRLQETSPSKISPYIEGAIGFHLISHVSL